MWRKTCVTLLLLMCVKDSLSQLDVCGRASLNPRIAGGTDAQEGAWPWMVSLLKSDRHFCGGSLINKKWVLTAAHCVIGKDKSKIRVHVGKLKQQGDNPNQSIKMVVKIISHLNYNKKTANNDIALLHLSSAVTFNEFITPVCLADTKSKFPPGTSSWITGWGDIGVTGKGGVKGSTTVSVPLPTPGTLQEVSIDLFEKNDCKPFCHGPITANMICVGTQHGGIGLWKGDSGGPMMSKQCSRWIQSGIVSHSYGCAQSNKPNVFTRVSEYKKYG